MERPAPAPEASGVSKVSRAPEPAATPHRESASPFPAASTPAIGYAETATRTEGALAVAPETSAPRPPAPTVDSLRHAVGSALVNAGHSTAATLLGTSNWILEATSLRIEVPGVGKKMLSLTINAAAEKIIRQELQRLNAPARFMVVLGEGAAQASAPMAAPLAGSVQEAALAHPLVERAKEIFNADVRSVVDLRLK
jgi:DNA polymerase-3 subunit gamma/tau